MHVMHRNRMHDMAYTFRPARDILILAGGSQCWTGLLSGPPIFHIRRHREDTK